MAAKSRAAKAYEAKKTTIATLEMPSAEKVSREKTSALIAKATEKSHKAVVESIASLKLSLVNALDSISNQLAANLTELKEVQDAISAEKMNLELIHGITAEANSLETLIQTNKEQQESFEREMAEARAEWNEEQTAHEKQVDAEEADLKTRRQREEEQYIYNTQKRRRDEEDSFKANLAARTREFEAWVQEQKQLISNREATVAAAETELKTLRDQVARFEETSKKETDRAVAIATNGLKRDLEHKHEVEKLNLNNQLSLKSSEITSLSQRLAELGKLNTELDTKYKQASDKVQQIAEKAIEGAQKVVFQTPSNDSTGTDQRRK